MYSWLSSNVIQTIGDNINHGINNAVTVLENFDEEFNAQGNNEEDEQAEVEIYKKLLEDAQMQHVELSKQYRVALFEKEAELKVWKKKCLTESQSEEELKEAITTATTTAEFEALKLTLSEIEEKMRTLLCEKNEAAVKLSQYPELLAELAELRVNIQARSELEAKKSDEIDDLVQEYSKLAAESEKQKSTDTLRLKELELENEELRTKLQAFEHSIAELADRSNSTPGSPARVQTVQLISETELKQLRTKLLNLEYDITEKNEKILKLELEIKNNRHLTNSETEVSEKISQEDIKNLELSLARKIEECNHLGSDISRLQLEKQEAETTGRKFYEQLRLLQKEVEANQRKLKEEENNDNEQASRLESELAEAKKEFTEKMENQLAEFNKLSNQLQSLQTENEHLKVQLETLKGEKNQLLESHQNEIHALKSNLDSQNELIQSIQNEKIQFQSQLSSSASDKDLHIANLQTTITNLQSEKLTILTSHQQELNTLKAELELKYQTSLNENRVVVTSELKKAHMEEMDQIRSTHDTEITSLAHDIENLKSQIAQEKENSVLHQEKLVKEHKESLNLLEEKISALENKAINDKEEMTRVHEQNLVDLRVQLIQEGQELSDRNVAESLKQAEINHDKLIKEQQAILEAATIQRIQETILEQNKLRDEALVQQQHTLLSQHEQALVELRDQLNVESNNKLMALKDSHTQELQEQKNQNEKLLQESLENLRNDHEENMRIEKLNYEREIMKIRADHRDEIDRLNEEKNLIQQQLSKIESIHAEKLRVALEELTLAKDRETENAVRMIKSEMQALVDTAYTARDEYLALYTKENKQRKALHNKLMDIQGNIRVICRVRPILDVERRSGEGTDATEILSDEDIIIHRDQSTKNRFEFDRVLSPGTPQEAVFEAVQPLIVSVLDGYNVCIFAYGQTGSGKTYTMEGYGTDIGVSPRAIDEVFSVINSCTEDWAYTVSFSSLEIYNESIRDLLDNNSAKDKLDVRQTPEGNSVPGLTEIPVTHSAEVLDLMRQSQTNRAVGAHDMNEHSSRSHSILTLTCRGRNLRDGSTTYGKLHLIDLAGSERVGKTDATGERLKEAQNINRSLSALGDVINALGKKSTHIPYRNSKLTFLLQDSLGGNSKVLMFVNISPAAYNVGESICSLGFAQRCRSLELGQAKKQSDTGGVKKSSSSANISNSSPTEVATPSKSSSTLSSSSSSTLRRPPSSASSALTKKSSS